jgi:hypothetical protein
VKGVLHVIAKKQFVAEYLFVAVKDWLTSYVTQLDVLGIIARRRGRGIRHNPFIGSEKENSSLGATEWANGGLFTDETNLIALKKSAPQMRSAFRRTPDQFVTLSVILSGVAVSAFGPAVVAFTTTV